MRVCLRVCGCEEDNVSEGLSKSRSVKICMNTGVNMGVIVCL